METRAALRSGVELHKPVRQRCYHCSECAVCFVASVPGRYALDVAPPTCD